MNVQKIDTNVGHLVDMVERGELRLPEMQRRYVWTATRVRDLLDSLYRGYPSGTILVWETDQEQPARDLAVTQARTAFTPKLLLDGQQRITSLSAVIRGETISVRNRKRPIDIAFNLDHPEGAPVEVIEVDDDSARPEEEPDAETTSEADDDTDGPALLDRLRERTFAVASSSLLSSKNWVLVSDVFKGVKNDWELIQPLVESPADPKFAMYMKRLQRLRGLRDYGYVMQVIPRTVSYEETAEIFVRVNSLGVKLRGSDLAMALVTAKWPNSLKLFEQFIDECEESWFTFDPGLIVRSVVVFATEQSRFNTVRSITKPQLEEAWEKAKKGIAFAVNFLRSNAGIEDESLLSSPLLMIPIAVYSQLKKEKLSTADESALLRWLFIANARGHFSGSSETVLDSDLSILFRGGKPSDLIPVLEQQFGRLTIEPADIIGKGIRSALFSLSYLALKRGGAKDWYSGLGLSLTHQGRYHFIQFHHVFPKSLLQAADEGYEKSEINEIANMAFITGRTNQRLSKKPPEVYFPKIIDERGETALRDQLIPMDRNLWKVENYRDFLTERRRLLTQAINDFIAAEAYVREVLGEMSSARNLLVINDEAHHAWRVGAGVKIAGVSKSDKEQATKWIGGLDRIHAARGISGCFDFSATPFVPTGKQSSDERLFDWIVSDFGLNDAIESGLVKTPRVVVRDDGVPNATTYRSRLYHIYNDPTVKDDLNRPADAHEPLPDLVTMGYYLLGKDWLEARREWQKSGQKVPPVMITVANRTETAARIKHAFDHGKIRLDELCAPDRTLHIDSKVLDKAEEADEPVVLAPKSTDDEDESDDDGGGDEDTPVVGPKLTKQQQAELLQLPQVATGIVRQCLTFIFERVELADELQHLGRALPVGLLGVEELAPRVSPAGDFGHASGIDAVVPAVGVGLQIALEVRQPCARSGTGAVGRVVVDDVRVMIVADGRVAVVAFMSRRTATATPAGSSGSGCSCWS